MNLAILGAGGHGQVVADAFLLSHASVDAGVALIGFHDDAGAVGKLVMGVPILGPLRELSPQKSEAIVVAIGDNRRRREIFDDLIHRGFTPYSVRHPQTTLATDVQTGAGSMVLAGVIVNTRSVIGRNVILNTGCVLDHHATVGDHVHVGPGAQAGGNVTIGEGAFIGLGAVLLPGVSVGAWAIVGAGSVVLKDVPPDSTVAGNPARNIHP